MATINSETVYDVGLDADEISRIANDGEVAINLPTGDTIRLTASVAPVEGETSPDLDTDRDIDPTEDANLEDIEQLVSEAEQEKRNARTPEDAEDDADAEDDEDVETEDVETEGNSQVERNGMIEIERGGEVDSDD